MSDSPKDPPQARALDKKERDTLIDCLLARKETIDDNEFGQALLAEHYPELSPHYDPWGDEQVGSWELAATLRRVEQLISRFVKAGFDENQARRAVFGRTHSFRLGSYQTGLYERELPAEIIRFAWLQNLDAYNNKLTHWPTEISQLPRLRVLNLQHNKLQEVPAAIAELSQLEELELSGNPLRVVSAALNDLPRLRRISIDAHRLDAESRALIKKLERRGAMLKFSVADGAPYELG